MKTVKTALVSSLVIMTLCQAPSYAETSVTGQGKLYESGVEYRYLNTVSTKWTGKGYVTSKWYYLKKGDQLFYYEGEGNNRRVTATVGYGAAKVSVNVPLGRKSGTGEGIAKKAACCGYYKIRVNKKIRLRIKTYQTRKYDFAKKKPAGKWSRGTTVSKKKKVLCVKAELVKRGQK